MGWLDLDNSSLIREADASADEDQELVLVQDALDAHDRCLARSISCLSDVN